MKTDRKVPDADETPEYPLPSPTDSLSRDQRPPDDDDAGVEQVPSDDDIEADSDDRDDGAGAGEPAITKRQ
ncbi:hypothetical protein PS938_00345 [Pseudomonas fluorescens]|uniref:Uncharacterized protein n=1 Tax=Pseudomonas fluorescens TaxID=294 RepID=A0A5E7RS41_PSEFL|nr:hypothetical protein [Pseudomonas fluorescens]VVP77186.1 hypothetical protein PS938_00345 [Pseudomonas fluorescens]